MPNGLPLAPGDSAAFPSGAPSPVGMAEALLYGKAERMEGELTRKNAFILTLENDTSETEELLFALGVEAIGVVRQRRTEADPRLFLGRGKLEEARALMVDADATLAIVQGDLKPGQVFALEDVLNEGRPEGLPRVEVYDRVRLILEIFAERAKSEEARLQVELAKLRYEMPLVKEWIHLSKKGERPGFLAGGEYEVNHYYDMMKRRIARIQEELARLSRERGVRRKHRRRQGFHLVSLAGYTNAGKSSLLRLLSTWSEEGPESGDSQARAAKAKAAEILVENRYFSTLATRTRRAQGAKREILVTDTVGFIEALPPWLVEAFHSTLEEIALADVILLVVDASDAPEELSRRLRSSTDVLLAFDHARGRGTRRGMPRAKATRDSKTRAGPRVGSALAPVLVVLNKVDLVTEAEVDSKIERLMAEGLIEPGRFVLASAKTGTGVAGLYEAIYDLLASYDDYEVALPQGPETEGLIGWLYENTDVLDLTRGNEVHIHFEGPSRLRSEIVLRLESAGATRLREAQRGLHESPGPTALREDALRDEPAS